MNNQYASIRGHYVPEGYLKFFTNDAVLLRVLDKKKNSVFFATPRKVARKWNYYAVNTPDGPDNSLDAIFGSEIEAPAYEAIRQLQSGDIEHPNQTIILSVFLGFQIVRGPSLKNPLEEFMEKVSNDVLRIVFANEERAQDVMERARSAGHEIPDVSFETMVDFLQRDDFTITEPTNVLWLKSILPNAAILAQVWLDHDWIVLDAPEGKTFLTSDTPTPRSIPELLTKNAVPLTKTMAVTLLPQKSGTSYRVKINEEQLNGLNRKMKDRALRFIFSSEEIPS